VQTSVVINSKNGHDEVLYNGLKTSLSSDNHDCSMVDGSDGNCMRISAWVYTPMDLMGYLKEV